MSTENATLRKLATWTYAEPVRVSDVPAMRWKLSSQSPGSASLGRTIWPEKLPGSRNGSRHRSHRRAVIGPVRQVDTEPALDGVNLPRARSRSMPGEGKRLSGPVDSPVRPHVRERLRFLRGIRLVGVPGAARHLRRPQDDPVLSLCDLDLRLLLAALEGARKNARGKGDRGKALRVGPRGADRLPVLAE